MLPPADHHKHRVAERRLYGVEGSSTFLECIPKSMQARVTWTFQKHPQNPREEVRGVKKRMEQEGRKGELVSHWFEVLGDHTSEVHGGVNSVSSQIHQLCARSGKLSCIAALKIKPLCTCKLYVNLTLFVFQAIQIKIHLHSLLQHQLSNFSKYKIL